MKRVHSKLLSSEAARLPQTAGCQRRIYSQSHIVASTRPTFSSRPPSNCLQPIAPLRRPVISPQAARSHASMAAAQPNFANAMNTRGIVAHSREKWVMEDLQVRDIEPDELLVEMVASGICHTDVAGAGDAYPRVLGHEGSGYVRRVGKDVTVAAKGDPVLLSFDSCGKCKTCATHHPAYCVEFVPRNLLVNDATFRQKGSDGATIGGPYFGQSSFANFSVVKQRSVVNAKTLIKNEDELKLFAPLGCGIQTGSGAIKNIAQATSDDAVIVIGCGGVGLAAIMAARILGCKQIIACDLFDSRLELARSLGASDSLNSKHLPDGETLVDAVRRITGGIGADVCLDTTGIKSIQMASIDFLAPRGRTMVVATEPGVKIEIDLFPFFLQGKQLLGAIEGDAVTTEYLPQMIEWYRTGKFPIDKLIEFFPAEKFEDARHSMHTGEVIKPVILWK